MFRYSDRVRGTMNICKQNVFKKRIYIFILRRIQSIYIIRIEL